MKHPDDKCNESQAEFLAQVPEQARRYHELIFIVGNATVHYHRQAKEYHPTESDWKEWLDGLPENIRKSMVEEGFEKCKRILSFTRYVMEKNDIGLDEFLKANIAPDVLKEYYSLVDPNPKT
jgi:hypothetical protein